LHFANNSLPHLHVSGQAGQENSACEQHVYETLNNLSNGNLLKIIIVFFFHFGAVVSQLNAYMLLVETDQ